MTLNVTVTTLDGVGISVDPALTTILATKAPQAALDAEQAARIAADALLIPKGTLSADGNLLTRIAGVPGEVTRAQLAADPALTATYVPKWMPNTAYTAGGYTLNPSGQIVSANTTFTSSATYNAANWTVTSGGGGGGTIANGSVTAAKLAADANSLGGPKAMPLLVVFGHSYVAGPVSPSQLGTNATMVQRLVNDFRFDAISIRGVGGHLFSDMAGIAFGVNPWVPGTRALIVVLGTLNDENNTNTAKGVAGANNALKAMFSLFAAGAKVPNTNTSYFTYTGTWTTFTDSRATLGAAKSTVTQNSYVDVTWTGDACAVVLHGLDGAGATVEVSVGATVVQTVNLTDQMFTTPAGMPWVHYPIRLSGYGAGDHTVRIKKTDAGAGPLRVDCCLWPAATPPNVVIVKNGVTLQVLGYDEAARLAIVHAAVDTQVAAVSNVLVADVADTGWNASVMIGQDLIHANDAGQACIADAVGRKVRAMPWSNGTSILRTLVLPTLLSPVNTPVNDTFTRADSTTTLGNAETGQLWVPRSGTWGISTNKAYSPNAISTGTVAWVEGSGSDATVDVDLTYAAGGDALFFRGVGATYSDGWSVLLVDTLLALYTPDFGSYTSISVTHTVGVTYHLRVVTSGPTIQVYRNTVLSLSNSSSVQQTNTKFGMRACSPSTRFDNFTVV